MARRQRRSVSTSGQDRMAAIVVALVLLVVVLSVVAQHLVAVGLGLIAAGLVVILYSRWRNRRYSQAEAAARQAQVEHAQHLGQLLVGSGAEFEQAVHSVFAAQGYQLEMVGKAGDRGVDLRGVDPGGWPVIIQCKRYGPDNKVSSPAIQGFMGAVVNHGASSGIFITTSTFTRDARRYAEESRVPIWLLDGAAFTAMARSIKQQ